MTTRRSLWLVFLLGTLPPLGAQPPATGGAGPEPAMPTVADLVEQLKQREQGAKTVSLSMRSRTKVPDGPEFEASGTLRVLDRTHFAVNMRMKVGEGMEGEHEVVRTPMGTWTRESNPMNGEVFTHMDQETMRQLEEASAVLGDEVPLGAIPGQSEAPLGSAMLESLAKHFDLKVTGKVVRDGLDHWVVRGEARPAGEQGQDDGLPKPDRVDLLVRTLGDQALAVVKMTQFSEGSEVMTLEIDEVVLDHPMAESTFTMDTRGRTVLDVMEHEEAARQIRDVLERARRKKEGAGKEAGASERTGEAGGKKGDGGR